MLFDGILLERYMAGSVCSRLKGKHKQRKQPGCHFTRPRADKKQRRRSTLQARRSEYIYPSVEIWWKQATRCVVRSRVDMWRPIRPLIIFAKGSVTCRQTAAIAERLLGPRPYKTLRSPTSEMFYPLATGHSARRH